MNYKKVLYLGCVTDFFYAFWNFLAEPDVTTIDGIYFSFTRGVPGYLPFPFTAWTVPFTLFFIYFSVVNVAVQFIYRYLLLCWKITLNKLIFLSLVAFGAIAVISYCMFFAYYLMTRTVDDMYYAHLLIGTDWMVNGKIPYFGAIPVAAFVNGFYISYPIVFVSYMIVIFCGISLFRKIKATENLLHIDMKKYQRQITVVMTVEAILPIITVVFPILLDCTTILLKINFTWAGKITFLLSSFAPVINPLVKLMVISCYRKRIKSLLPFHSYFTSPSVAPNHFNSFPDSKRLSIDVRPQTAAA
uniref:Uncharacterized protein n=1 Tax=Panagrolaimus sp. ES5 TaxID=591445 RepID=A0AC34F9B1_9BILA